MPVTISKSRFKPQALKYFRQIQESGQELIITDYGKPVLKISPYQEDVSSVFEELRGSVKRFDDPLEPVGVDDREELR